MKPNACCNFPAYLVRTWHNDTLWRKVKRVFRTEPLPHRLVDTCSVCKAKHYLMIVPEIPIEGIGTDT